MEKKDQLLEGDGILLYCPKAKGFVFSPPPLSPQVSHVTLYSIAELSHINYPGFPNVHYAAFEVIPRKCTTLCDNATIALKRNKNLVYGRKVKLIHVASRMYLSLSKKGSVRNPVASLEKEDEADTFRILPSDAVKTTGQIIHVQDKVRLEIVGEVRNQVLCAPNVLKLSGYDLKKASEGSDFVMYSQTNGDKIGPQLALRGGEVVMFLNEKRESYLSILAAEFRPDDTIKVMAKVSDGASKSAINGGDCFWQIENAAIQYNGNWVEFEDTWTVRLKHLPTQQYLAVVNDQLILKSLDAGEDETDPETSFLFEEDAADDQSGILKRRYVRIKHKGTDEYINLQSFAPSFGDGQRWFTVSLKEPGKDAASRRNQKFWLEEVDSGLLDKFSVLSGAFITLRDYMNRLNDPDEIDSDIAQPSDIVDELAKWTSKSSGGYQERWPDMMRVIEGVELVYDFLEKETIESTKHIQRQLCTVLKNYVEYASEESQLYLSKNRLLDILFEKMGQDINAEGVLSALVKSYSFDSEQKKKVTNRLISDADHILNVILCERKDYAFLDCLSALCLSGTRGRPDRAIQETLLDKILIPGHEQGMFFKVAADKEKGIVLIKPKMLQTESELDDKFLIAQINFYSAVCAGVNLNSIKKLVEDHQILSYDVALRSTEYEIFKPAVQSAFFSALVSTLVDKNTEESGTDLESIWFIYAWKHFVETEKAFDPILLSAIAETHDIISDKDEMEKIEAKIMDALKRDRLEEDICKPGGEELITQKLSVLERLVAYGFFWRNPRDIIKTLIHILSWKKVTVESEVIDNLKAQTVEVLHLFLKQTYHLSTARILYDYRYFKNVGNLPQDYISPGRLLEVLMRKDFVKGTNDQEKEARRRMKWMLYGDDTDYKIQLPGQEINYDYKQLNVYAKSGHVFPVGLRLPSSTDQEEKLVDHLTLFLQSDSDTLRFSAAKLLFDLFQGETYLFERSKLAYIVSENSWEKYVVMVNYATYQDKDGETPVRILLRLQQGQAEEKRIKKFTSSVMFDCGYWPDKSGFDPADETSMYTAGQNVIFATGVFGVLLNYVIKFCSSDDLKQENLMRLVCNALVRVVRNNLKIKEAVFLKFSDLLEAKLAVSSVAHLLTEVLTDNITACRQLPVAVVRRIFRLAMREDNPEYTEYITTLVAWMKISTSSPQFLKSHQEVVVTLFGQYFQDHYEENWDPIQHLTEPQSKDKLEKMLSLSYMMGVCTGGQHKYAEDVCQPIFTLPTLFRIITNPDIAIDQKTIFLFLLNEAYLKTERDSLRSVVEFANEKELWAHFEEIADLIAKLNHTLRSKSDDEKCVEYVKVKMRVLFSQHLSYKDWKEHTIMKINNRPVNKEKEKINQAETALLQYIVDGIVPLLSTFCTEYKELRESYGNQFKELKPQNVAILTRLENEIVDLVKGHPQIFLSTKSQVDYWTENLHNMKLLVDPKYDPQLELTVSIEEESEKLQEENQLNDEFKVYLDNFRSISSTDMCNDPADDLFPKFHGFLEFLTRYFPENPPTLDRNGHYADQDVMPFQSLGKLLEILHKKLQQSLDSTERATYDKLLIKTLQSLSGILHHVNNKHPPECEYDDNGRCMYCDNLKKWQDAFVVCGIHEKALIHLVHIEDDVALQVLGLLKYLTYNANQHAQDRTWECISSRESIFCARVYKLLENVTAVFGNPVASQRQMDSYFESSIEGHDRPTDSQIQSSRDQTSKDNTPLLEHVEEQFEGSFGVPLITSRYDSMIEKAGNVEDSAEENIRTACIVLDCISNLCDGQNRQMQRFLHDQESSLRKLDTVKKIAVLLQVLVEQYERNFTQFESPNDLKKFALKFLTVITKAIQALIETCAGSYNNQEAVFHCQITDTINLLLAKLINGKKNPPNTEQNRKEVCLKAIELLQVLLEETDERSIDLIVAFTEDVDLNVIIDTMFMCEIERRDQTGREDKNGGISAYHILRLIADTLEISMKDLVKTREFSRDQMKILDEYRVTSCRIEVMYKPTEEDKKILTRVYFPFDTLDKLTEEEKEKINNGIAEESLEETLTEFTKLTKSIRLNALYKSHWQKNYIWLYRFIYEASGPRHYLLVFLTLLLNLLVLIVFEVPESETTDETNSSTNIIWKPSTPLWYSPFLLIVLGVPHLLLGICMVVEYFVRQKKRFTTGVSWFDEPISNFKEWVTQQECLKRVCPLSWREPTKSNSEGDNYFGIELLGFQSIYRVLFIVSSLLAIGLSGYFYCFCLIYVFLNSDVVQYMLTALHRSAKQLIYIALIGLVVILIFAVIAFAFLHDYMDDNENLFCSTLFECFITVSREGLLDTLGPAIPFINDNQLSAVFSTYSLRSIFFDIPFFIIVTLIGLNIVTAVLIDRFGELREERDKIENLKSKSCFICGYESERFDRETKDGFKGHVRNDHSKWNYIYFMIYLDGKEDNDMTALEKQVYEANPIDGICHIQHFPVKKAKVIKEVKGEE